MNYFLKELRERGVFRITALYGAVVWFLLQVADVIFPAFDISDSVLRSGLLIALILLPVVILFTWFFEFTDQGIKREEEVRTGTATRLMTGNKVYFIIIALLFVALSISIYINVQEIDISTDEKESLSIMIADFENLTNDDVFSGSIEHALAIGIEGANFISAYPRSNALKLAKDIDPSDILTEKNARLISIREGVNLVLSGSIAQINSEYRISQEIIDPIDGRSVAELQVTAEQKSEVLLAVSKLANQTREVLGDVTLKETLENESFSTTSLQAVKYYTLAQKHTQSGNEEEAIKYYQMAISEDISFGRAYSGYALSLFKTGQNQLAHGYWKKSLAYLGTMTPREKYRTLGLYYSRATGNYQKAIEIYKQLVEEYPSDWVGHNNLAVAYFLERQFEQAQIHGKIPIDMFPANPLFRTNYALYAMYSSNFDIAAEEAKMVLEGSSSYYKAFLPLAIAYISKNEKDLAIKSYQQMAKINSRAASLATLGLTDVAIFSSDYEEALSIIDSSLSEHSDQDSKRDDSTKYIYQAISYYLLNQQELSSESLSQALLLSKGLYISVPAAILYIKMHELDKANEIIESLSSNIQNEPRAYADILKGVLAAHQKKPVEAVDYFLGSIKRTDTWLGHYELGKIYFSAEHYAEALSEFETCQKRLGEASSLFLNDVPSYHYAKDLFYFLGLAQQELDMLGKATSSFESYLNLHSGNLKSKESKDAKKRIELIRANNSIQSK